MRSASVFSLGLRAVGSNSADHEILLPGVAVQQRLESCHQRHVQRDPLLTAQVFEPIGQCPGQGEEVGRSLGGNRRCPRASDRQFQDLRPISQLLLPVGELFGELLPLQQLSLPDREIGVLEGQVRQRCRLSAREGFVQAAQLSQEHIQRPAIDNNVMHRQEQQELL